MGILAIYMPNKAIRTRIYSQTRRPRPLVSHCTQDFSTNMVTFQQLFVKTGKPFICIGSDNFKVALKYKQKHKFIKARIVNKS